jgi:hypothetical protein
MQGRMRRYFLTPHDEISLCTPVISERSPSCFDSGLVLLFRVLLFYRVTLGVDPVHVLPKPMREFEMLFHLRYRFGCELSYVTPVCYVVE